MQHRITFYFILTFILLKVSNMHYNKIKKALVIITKAFVNKYLYEIIFAL